MKLEFLSFDFEKFAQEMQNLKDKKGFDYLVTIVGEDFGGEEGLGCVYILENTKTHERCSVKMLAKTQVCGDGMSSNGTGETDGQMIPFIPTVSNIWKVADLLEREVYDFYGIVFLGHPDMRRLFLRSDFKGYPFRKDWQFNDQYTLEDDVEPDYGLEYYLDKDGVLQSKQNGAQVTLGDKKILEHLSLDMHFSSEVINILVEYVLNTSGNRLVPSFVDSVASQWARDGVNDRKTALAETKIRMFKRLDEI